MNKYEELLSHYRQNYQDYQKRVRKANEKFDEIGKYLVELMSIPKTKFRINDRDIPKNFGKITAKVYLTFHYINNPEDGQEETVKEEINISFKNTDDTFLEIEEENCKNYEEFIKVLYNKLQLSKNF